MSDQVSCLFAKMIQLWLIVISSPVANLGQHPLFLGCVNQAHGKKLLFSIQEWDKLELVRKVVFILTNAVKILHFVELCCPHATMLEPNHLTAHSTGITKVKRDSLDIPWLDIECFISYPKSDELHVNIVSHHSYM